MYLNTVFFNHLVTMFISQNHFSSHLTKQVPLPHGSVDRECVIFLWTAQSLDIKDNESLWVEVQWVVKDKWRVLLLRVVKHSVTTQESKPYKIHAVLKSKGGTVCYWLHF